ncbi:COX15/CtaA family protein [Maribacter polysiphoniae]|uniref:COX15/CtaA family protein n=1 Tax=Maribacter polysiphoniae TaxID=429344 RepID=A0A316E269_9FLAO|nr:COX15/CtaA family protein [Maribacter polysiphoniae]MBD1259171.1 COX15/CtaA family protein [Maribacter polysiphoniae]PWK24727.1 cytochrome c oxidase assembly protein subunit 15 [Maribacter polysiphoniae]
MFKKYHSIAKITLVLVYLVIIAGAVVRMTGSGMGCPDWPKCFGHLIPPTEESQLQWKPGQSYHKGQVIILNESLQVAKEDFTSGNELKLNHWEPYTKHDYAEFNPWHTWIEFVNRLFGALAGLGTLVLAFVSFGYWKKKKSITLLSWIVVFGMGFQAWLGATVVYSVLEPVKITLHMVMALLIVAILLYLIFRSNEHKRTYIYDSKTMVILSTVFGLTLIQIILGTQVRQFVDEQIDLVGETAKNLWLNKPILAFYIHRTFSIIVVLVNLYLAYRIYNLNLGLTKINWILSILLVEVISGMAMFYWNFPFMSQTLHLVLASLLFGVQFYLLLESYNADRSQKSS